MPSRRTIGFSKLASQNGSSLSVIGVRTAWMRLWSGWGDPFLMGARMVRFCSAGSTISAAATNSSFEDVPASAAAFMAIARADKR